MLEASGIKKSFSIGGGDNKKTIIPLNRLSFYLNRGEIVGLLGQSGAGKSTLAGILSGSIALDEGSVKIDGIELYKKGKYDRKEGRKIQLIPQKPLLSLDPTQRIGKAVEEALLLGGAKRKEAKERALSLFDEIGLKRSLYTRLPRQLSGGEAQRVLIVRALALNPSFLISDESTSMLDASTQREIVQLYQKLNQERGIGILFISHNKKLVEEIVERTYVLENGSLELVRKRGE